MEKKDEKKRGFVFIVGGTNNGPLIFKSEPGLTRRIAAIAGVLLALFGLGFIWGRMSRR